MARFAPLFSLKRVEFTMVYHKIRNYESSIAGVVIKTQPHNDTLCLGTMATFSVAAADTTGITYQWQEDAGMGFKNIVGATRTTLTLPSVSQDKIANKYRCLLTGNCTTASEAAALTLDSLPTITLEPQPQVACMGGDAYFMVIATSPRPMTYQWQFNSGVGFQNINGAINSTLSVANLGLNAQGFYRCTVSNGCSARHSIGVALSIPTDTVYYVDANAQGLDNGKNWANAFTSLQSALDRAKCAFVKSIYVAKGTYNPEAEPYDGTVEPSNQSTQTFYINTNIRLIGGYPTGGGTRNPKYNPTVLSNSQGRVLILRNTNATMILDGFTISNGNGGSADKSILWNDYTLSNANGGGIACVNATPTIRNCRFVDNTADNGGAIFAAIKTPASISDCIFESNGANYGGAVVLQNGSTTIKNCVFSENYGVFGGAISIDSSQTLTLSSCVFSHNEGDAEGGAVRIGQVGQTQAAIKNCTFVKNVLASGNNGAAICNTSTLELPVVNSIFYNNGGFGLPNIGRGTDILDSSNTAIFTKCMLQQSNLVCTNCISTNNTDPKFIDAINDPKGPDGIWATTDDGLALACNSPALNTGNDAFIDNSTDIIGRPRIAFTHSDLGAYEKYFDCDNNVSLRIKVFLQGPYDATTGLMKDSLRAKGFLPTQEPYTGLGFTHKGSGGGETVAPSVLGLTDNNAIVDWLFLELRDGSDSTRVVATRSALLQRDGDVVDLDGSASVTFSSVPIGNYYVAIRHRNHLPCRTSQAIPLSINAQNSLNFTNGSTPILGKNPLRAVGGVFALYAGDVNRDGQVAYTGSGNDRVAVLRIVGLNTVNNEYEGYYAEDANMDGTVRYTGAGNDRVVILSLVGLNSINNIIYQQF